MKAHFYALIFGMVLIINSNAAVLFYEATTGNTTQILTDGSMPTFGNNVTADPVNDGWWHMRTNVGYNGGAFVAGNGGSNVVPQLKTTVSGLIAGATYELYGFFWAGTQTPTGNNVWPIQFGMTGDGSALSVPMTVYRPTESAATLIAPGDTSFYEDGVGPTSGGQGLFYVKIGEAVADASGNLYVFVDNVPGAAGNRTWYEGIGFNLVPIPEPASLSLLGFGGLFLLRRRRNG